MKKILNTVCIALVSTALGLGAGWFAAEQSHAHGAHADTAPDAARDKLDFDVQTLAKLGVRLGRPDVVAAKRSYEVSATIDHTPGSLRLVTTPFEGDVLSIDAKLGSSVDETQSIVSILRQTQPFIEARLAAPLLRTVNEELHESTAKLIVAYAKSETTREELARLDAIDAQNADGELSLVDRQRLLDARYAHRRAKSQYEALSHKLEAHGVPASRVLEIARGAHLPHGPSLWRTALEHHRLWSKASDEVLARLPEDLRGQSRTVAALGELQAHGLLTEEALRAFAQVPALCADFYDAARLLLRGDSVSRVRWLAARGALGQTMHLRIPPSKEKSAERRWAVEALHVQVGQHVAAGSTVARLRDASEVFLVLTPIGDEVVALRKAFAKNAILSARPLLPGISEPLEDLRIDSIVDADASDSRARTRALIRCVNRVVNSGAGEDARTWTLLAGMRFLVRIEVPIEGPKLARLPHDAVVRRGSRDVVYGLGHGHPHDYSIRVVSRDERFVYFEQGAIPADEKVAVKGGLALALAIERDAAGHAGHGHSH